jgi:hypothetical protein
VELESGTLIPTFVSRKDRFGNPIWGPKKRGKRKKPHNNTKKKRKKPTRKTEKNLCYHK